MITRFGNIIEWECENCKRVMSVPATRLVGVKGAARVNCSGLMYGQCKNWKYVSELRGERPEHAVGRESFH